MIDTVPIPTVCPHCGGTVVYTSNAKLYGGRTYGNGRCYLCEGCGASVGTHRNHPREPLGILATPAMKGWKQNCHRLFDPLWKSKLLTRGEAYRLLAQKMGIPKKECHFGHFTEERLIQAWNILKKEKWWL